MENNFCCAVIGLCAGEIINALRRLQDNLRLYVVTPHDDFYSKRGRTASFGLIAMANSSTY